MLIELHCHTIRHSPDTSVDPVMAVRRAEHMGLQGLVLTEHGHLWTARALAELHRAAEIDAGFVLLAGQEVLTEHGPVLLLGADRSLPGRHTLAQLRAAWPEAALIWSNPYRHHRRPSEEQLLHACLDGVEIISGAHTHLAHARAIDDWHRLKFVATAGSDARVIEDVGRYPVRLDHPITTLAQLCVELRAGRVRPMLEETPRAGANNRLMEIVLGPDPQRERVIIKKLGNLRAWRRGRRALKVTQALRERGFADGPFRVPEVFVVDPRERVIIEHSQPGPLLFELLTTVGQAARQRYLIAAMRWLARLHAADLRVGSPTLTLLSERRRATSYARSFRRAKHSRAPDIRRWLAALSTHQRALLLGNQALCQVHGDFHPKNLLLAHDRPHDPATLYACAIDFANSQVHHPALDLAYFFVQLRYQLREHRFVFDEHELLSIYQAERPPVPDLPNQLPWFELRATLSIASYLIKLGKGDSEDMTTLLTQAQSTAKKLKIA